jgi:itaconate CoA-transferase
MGDADMYAFINDNPAMESYSSAYVNDLRIIALKSAAKNSTISCIVPRVQMATDTRMDVEHILTEYGCVNLRGKSTKERAELLISIAHPDFRGKLKRHAKSINLI